MHYGIPGYWHRNTLQDVPPSAFPGFNVKCIFTRF